MVVNQSFDKEFYRLAGYRNLGRRAVRADILERLADLIRPAINWKPGLGRRPDGAYDGQSFMVTPAMLSILGATPDDMEEILKGLGYRAEARPEGEVKARLEEIDAAAAAKAAAVEAATASGETRENAGEEGGTDRSAEASGMSDARAENAEGLAPETADHQPPASPSPQEEAPTEVADGGADTACAAEVDVQPVAGDRNASIEDAVPSGSE